jgi:hypothetical protein
MPECFATPNGYIQRSRSRRGQWRWKDTNLGDSGYISRFTAWRTWLSLGRPAN